jgi:hypothetical protein
LTPILLRFCISINSGENLRAVIGFNSPERLRPNSGFCLKHKVVAAVGELFKEESTKLKSQSRYSCSRDNINSLLTEPVVPKSSNIANIKLL